MRSTTQRCGNTITYRFPPRPPCATLLEAVRLIPHPIDPQRVAGQPRVFVGPIASANKLLKNPKLRDTLRDQFGVKAVEMEGSGITDATWTHEVGYLVVRGICHYCDSHKNDVWQGYAAVVAAAYTRGLLASMPVEEADLVRFLCGYRLTNVKGPLTCCGRFGIGAGMLCNAPEDGGLEQICPQFEMRRGVFACCPRTRLTAAIQ